MMIPMLFNTEMVQAIMAGRKTQTRRIAKQLCGLDPRVDGLLPENFKFWVSPLTSVVYWEDLERQVTVDGKLVLTPCWRNDILWVRETWVKEPLCKNGYFYRAAFNTENGDAEKSDNLFSWHPSIHMPKEAARIFLHVKDVRIERLQEISEEQAEQEGCAGWHIEISGGPWGVEDDPDEGTAVDDFQRVWDGTIKPADRDKYGWNANPWVWVIEFERCAKPEGWCV